MVLINCFRFAVHTLSGEIAANSGYINFVNSVPDACPTAYAIKKNVYSSVDLPTACCSDGRLDASRECPVSVDFYYLQDTSYTFADDLAVMRGSISTTLATLSSSVSSLKIGVGSFTDKPFPPFGYPQYSDYCWLHQSDLSSDLAVSEDSIRGLQTRHGGDGPRAQLEALRKVAIASVDIGFTSQSMRAIIVTTDAPYHKAGDGNRYNLPRKRASDRSICESEDYPSVDSVKDSLEENGITPLFFVTHEAVTLYEDLVVQLGRGKVVQLSRNSDNLLDAITQAFEDQVCTDVDDCTVNPCTNGGTCIDGINVAFCACRGGFSGPRCEIADPCSNLDVSFKHNADAPKLAGWMKVIPAADTSIETTFTQSVVESTPVARHSVAVRHNHQHLLLMIPSTDSNTACWCRRLPPAAGPFSLGATPPVPSQLYRR